MLGWLFGFPPDSCAELRGAAVLSRTSSSLSGEKLLIHAADFSPAAHLQSEEGALLPGASPQADVASHHCSVSSCRAVLHEGKLVQF